VVANDLGPVVDEIDVGFGADPRNRGGIADEWIWRVVDPTRSEIDYLDADLTTGKRIDVDAGNAEGGGII